MIIEMIIRTTVMVIVTETTEMEIEEVVQEVEVRIGIKTIGGEIEVMTIETINATETEMTETIKEEVVRSASSVLDVVTNLLVDVSANIQNLKTKVLMTADSRVLKEITVIQRIRSEKKKSYYLFIALMIFI